MLKRLIRLDSGRLIFILILVIFLSQLIFPLNSRPLTRYDSTTLTDTSSYWVDINDSLPHYLYKHIEDSVARIKTEKQQNDFQPSEGFYFSNVMGTISVGTGKDKEYYVGIGGYRPE